MSSRRLLPVLFAVLLPGVPGPACAADEPAVGAPAALDGVTVEERPGAVLPLDAPFTDDAGRPVRLGHSFDGRRPVVLVLGYYRCPMLCSLVIGGTASSLAAADRTPGSTGERGFRAVAVSIDPADAPGDAAPRRREIARASGGEAAAAWTFLTGSEESIERLADAVGFGYRLDPATDQYAHPAVVVAATPDGRVSTYVHGIRPDPAELDAAIEAAAGFEAGKSLGDLVAACFHYTPALREWSGAIVAGLRIGGFAILAAVGSLFGWLHWRRARRELSEGGGG